MIKIEQDDYISYDKTNTHISLIEMTMFHFSAIPEMQKHSLDNYILIYVQKGELNILTGKKKLTLYEKDILILPPSSTMQIMQSLNLTGGDTTYYTLEFSCSNFFFFDINEYVFKSKADIIDSSITEIYLLIKSSSEAEYLKDAKLLLILSDIKKLICPINKNQRVAEEAKTYIDTNIMKNINLDHMSNKLCYNKQYIFKLFNNHYGISLHDYISSERTKMAKRLLLQTDMSIESVAKALGYDEANYFIKFFKYNTKMSPSNFRKSSK